MRRVRRRAGFDRADNRGFERRESRSSECIATCVSADLLANRAHERPTHEAEEDGNRENAEGDDSAGREAEAIRGPPAEEQQREQRAGDHDDWRRAPRVLSAPAIPYAANDVNELQALVHAFLRKGQ